MASRLDKLQAASFKGVSFFVTSESLSEAGRKIALHEYPNSNQRFVEDLGQLPPRFKIQAFISGDNWINDSRAFESVLNSEGSGTLVMPTFGSREAYALPYTKDASQSSVGIINFSIEFAIGKPANAPLATTPTTQTVFAAGDDARLAIQTEFQDTFKTPTLIDTIKAVIGDIKDSASEVLSKIADQIPVATLQELQRKVSDIATKAPQLISNPTLLATELIQGTTDDPGVWQLASLGFGTTGTISSLNVLADYGNSLVTSESSTEVTGSSVGGNGDDETSANVPYWSETTSDRIERNETRRLLVRNNRLNALIAMYEQLAAGSYQTDADIQTARETVETRYNDIMLEGTANSDAIQSSQSVRQAVENVRILSIDVLEQKDQEVFGTVNISQKVPTSQFVISYTLYAEEFIDSELLTDRSIVVRGLNPNESGISMNGSLEVLQGTN